MSFLRAPNTSIALAGAGTVRIMSTGCANVTGCTPAPSPPSLAKEKTPPAPAPPAKIRRAPLVRGGLGYRGSRATTVNSPRIDWRNPPP